MGTTEEFRKKMDKDLYKHKIIEMVNKIENQDYLFKIYHYIHAKYTRDNKWEETNN